MHPGLKKFSQFIEHNSLHQRAFDERSDRVYSVCFTIITLSFWIDLAWAWLTHRDKDSFYVGAAVVATAIWMLVDVSLFCVGMFYAARGLWTRQVLIKDVFLRWSLLFIAPLLSFYLTNKLTFILFPFLVK